MAEIYVAEGALLEPGQPLFRLEAFGLEAQRDQWRAQLASAQAALEKARNGPRVQEIQAARAAKDAAEARWKRLKEGWRPEEVRQAISDREAAEADLLLAREEQERASNLYRREATSRADFDTARAAFDRARGRAASARLMPRCFRPEAEPRIFPRLPRCSLRLARNLDLLLAGTRPEEIAEAEAAVAQVRGKLTEIEDDLREAVVRAPERSVLEVLAVRPGDLLVPNASAARVLRADDLWVKAYVPEPELGRVRLNQRAWVTIDAYPGRKFEGRVMQIASISEFTPRNIQSADERRFQVFGIKVRVADSDDILKSGLAAQVELPLMKESR